MTEGHVHDAFRCVAVRENVVITGARPDERVHPRGKIFVNVREQRRFAFDHVHHDQLRLECFRHRCGFFESDACNRCEVHRAQHAPQCR